MYLAVEGSILRAIAKLKDEDTLSVSVLFKYFCDILPLKGILLGESCDEIMLDFLIALTRLESLGCEVLAPKKPIMFLSAKELEETKVKADVKCIENAKKVFEEEYMQLLTEESYLSSLLKMVID